MESTEEHPRRAEVEHIGHRVLKARQDEDGNAEQDARDGLLVAVDAHRHVHEDAAEDTADQGLPPDLGQAGGAEHLGHAPDGGDSAAEGVSQSDGGDEVAQKSPQKDGKCFPIVLFGDEADLTRVEGVALVADGEQGDGEEEGTDGLIHHGAIAEAGEEHRPAHGDHDTGQQAVCEIPDSFLHGIRQSRSARRPALRQERSHR